MANALKLASPSAKVLIVEDEDTLRESMVFRFEREGFSVFEASNGHEALSIIQDQMPDIILTDIRMPKMGGKEFLQNIKKKYDNGNSPIIFCITGYSDLSEREAAELWVDRYFHKPFDPSVLVAASRADLEKLRSRIRLKNSFLSFIKEENFEGFLTAAMMHEINNMLNIGNFSAIQLKQHFEKYIPDPKVAKAVRRIESVFKRMQGVAGLLTKVIRNQNVQPERSSLQAIIKNVLDEVQVRFSDCQIKYTPTLKDDVMVMAIPFAPHIVLVNLIKNAYEAQQGDGGREVSIFVEKNAQLVNIRITNPGSIPDDVAKKIFEPFYSTKLESSQAGMGIGLAIAKNLAEESGGSLILERHHGATEFCLTMPRAEDSK